MKRVCIALLWACSAEGATIVAQEGSELVIPIEPNGSTVQLPTYVRIVTPSRGYHIEPVLSVAPSVPADGNSQGAQSAQDVKTFFIKPSGGDAERVTFILADERSLSVRFVPSAVGGDNFYDIKWPTKARSASDQGFLSSERSLMLTMLRDENAAGRKVVNQILSIDKYPDLGLKMVRTYQTDGLTGYVLLVENNSDRTIQVNPTVLGIGVPNRVVMTQMDHELMKPCGVDASPNPRGTGCQSVVRLIVRGATSQSIGLTVDHKGAFPFLLSPKEIK